MKILMIEDDKTTVEVVKLTMSVHDPGSTIKSNEKGRDGLESARSERFDVVILDLGLPDIDGIRVLEELRAFSKTPVVIVSARHDSEVITNALDLGAQDYILKPFNFQALLASIKEASTQSDTAQAYNVPFRITDNLTICRDNHEVFVKGIQVELLPDEWKVLSILLENCGKIVPIKTLSTKLSEDGFAGESTVHLIINRLRRKLGDDPYIPQIIITEYECGFRFLRPTTAVKIT
jgi:two-component system KDP operon response regulator KdpE